MNSLENYYQNIIRYDLANKFLYTKLDEIPKLKKMVLNFGCKNHDIKNIASALFSLKLISTNQGRLTKTKKANVLIKVRKGYPVGCAVVLKKHDMYKFLSKLLSEIFPNLKNFKGLKNSMRIAKNSFSFTLIELINFKSLEKQFYLFTNLPPMNITFVTNSKTKTELIYLLRSFKLPLF